MGSGALVHPANIATPSSILFIDRCAITHQVLIGGGYDLFGQQGGEGQRQHQVLRRRN
jgi:hypothetical protein